MRSAIIFGVTLLSLVPRLVCAQDGADTMTATAKTGQNLQNALYPYTKLPVSYNYNQKMGSANSGHQNEYSLNPVVPVSITDDVKLLINPLLTYNNNSGANQVTDQYQPLQLALPFIPAHAKYWYAGFGPYFQTPASNANNGSKQAGVGFTSGLFFTPEHWVIGTTMYNSWGVGSDMSGGSANVLYFQPLISYTTDSAWTYNLLSQISYNYNAHNSTNQLTLSGGKTVKFGVTPVQVQFGPTYMATTNSMSAKGVGAFLGLTVVLPK